MPARLIWSTGVWGTKVAGGLRGVSSIPDKELEGVWPDLSDPGGVRMPVLHSSPCMLTVFRMDFEGGSRDCSTVGNMEMTVDANLGCSSSLSAMTAVHWPRDAMLMLRLRME